MSRYKKIITGEMELPEVSGNKFIIYPTIETKLDMLDLVKSIQIVEEVDERDSKGNVIGTKRIKNKYFDLSALARICGKMIYEGCYNHNSNGERINKKEDEINTTEKDILEIVLASDILSLFFNICEALDIIDKNKANELRKVQSNAEKK